MPLAYSLADVFVSASIEPEAFGRIAVESQSMGKPIIASNIGGSKETILNGKSGFLYFIRLASRGGNMIKTLLNSKELYHD